MIRPSTIAPLCILLVACATERSSPRGGFDDASPPDGAVSDAGADASHADLPNSPSPTDARADSDAAIPELCGNGALDPGELCDPAIAAGTEGACPSECDPEACSTATLVGSACNVRCESATLTECIDDDGCCPSTCDALGDTDCLDDVTAWGTIFLGAYTHPTTTVSTASVSFTGRTTATSTCTMTTDGHCTLYECPTSGPTPPGPRYESAGRVTISGGTGGAIIMNPNADRTYTGVRFMESTPKWSPGAAITISAAGSTVPSFTLRGTFPSELTPLSPTPVMTPTGRRVSATRSSGLRFSWTGERTGDAVASVSQAVGTTSQSVSCRFPAADRSGTMPRALLGRLSATASDGTPTTFVSLSHGGSTARTLAGDTLVTMWMNGSAGMSAFVDLR